MTRVEVFAGIPKDDLVEVGTSAGLTGDRLRVFATYAGVLLQLDVDEYGLVVVKNVNGVDVPHPTRMVI